MQCLAGSKLPGDIGWRWPGSYAVVEEAEDGVALHTDPAAARPVYLTAYRGGWAWCTSARALASLIGAPVDTQRLACSVFLPSAPALAGSRTFFTGVEQLPPGSRIELPADGSSPRCTTLWRPDTDSAGSPVQRLRSALTATVALRVAADQALSCDLSGGLDSTSVAVLAAHALPPSDRLNAVTIHPEGDTSGADLHYARLTAEAHEGRIAHHLLPMAAEHLPYTRITAVPATDEPAPSTLTQARLTGQLRWMRTNLGSHTHLTGDGGDSVLFQPPLHLADLIRHRRWKRAANEACGWARLRHHKVLPFLVDATRAARASRRQALANLAPPSAHLAETITGASAGSLFCRSPPGPSRQPAASWPRQHAKPSMHQTRCRAWTAPYESWWTRSARWHARQRPTPSWQPPATSTSITRSSTPR